MGYGSSVCSAWLGGDVEVKMQVIDRCSVACLACAGSGGDGLWMTKQACEGVARQVVALRYDRNQRDKVAYVSHCSCCVVVMFGMNFNNESKAE
jgi:hypothetical protein